LRVLVVDDTPGSAEILAALLRKLYHLDARIATDGPSALALAQEFSPQVVLLDIGLPGMSGYEVARRLRQQPRFYDVLLVALTGYGADEDRRRSKEAGFDEHLVKPASTSALRELFRHAKISAMSRSATDHQ
jgi:CheY-like chemotaxis protein